MRFPDINPDSEKEHMDRYSIILLTELFQTTNSIVAAIEFLLYPTQYPLH